MGSTLQRDAPEVRCKDGVLEGAPLSDNGYVIINMFFDYPIESAADTSVASSRQEQPGRVSEVAGVKFQDEFEYASMCEQRKNNGYNSGMGEIFRRVAGISPIVIPSTTSATSLLEAPSTTEPQDTHTECSKHADPAACLASRRNEL